ncbi:MAG: cell wall biogenesis glycosyltransferase [uncultured bacterium]|nr:MAG: cell wall biogenesis glycosyltransferase [uncultured bacterium]
MVDSASVAILIPVYNEKKTIKNIIQRCRHYSKNIIVVDDGSTDDTLSEIDSNFVVLMQNKINLGKGASLLKGFKYIVSCSFSGVITLDADGQHDPADLSKFFELITKTPESIIIGARTLNTRSAPWKRWLANKAADAFVSLVVRKKLQDTQSGFRYYPARFLATLDSKNITNRFAFETEILIKAVHSGFLINYIEICSCYPKESRHSYYQPIRDSIAILNSIRRSIFYKKLSSRKSIDNQAK